MAEVIAIDRAKFAATPTKSAAGVLPDAAERQRALDVRNSWIVEAPAGSGKTGLLIQRYLKLLADDSVAAPEQVLAITFTKKATGELRDRVLAQLHAASSNEATTNGFDRETRPFAAAVLARSSALGWQLLDQPHRLNIRTIDSVCSEIANSLPVLSGTGGRRSVIDDAYPLYTTAARRTFLQLGGSDSALGNALRIVLLHRDGNLAECERLLAGMLALRDQWGELVPLGRRELDDAYLDATILPRLERALEQAICAALTQLAKTIPATLLNELTATAAAMAHIQGYNGIASPIAICANKTLSPGDRAEDLDHWRALIHLLVTQSKDWRKSFTANVVKFELSKPEQARLKSLIAQFQGRDDLLAIIRDLDALPPAKYPAEQWLVAKALFRVLNHTMAELQLVFAERSECDYAEIALAAKTALRSDDGPNDLEAALGLRLQHILVDEMQDTSSSQYELIQMLTAHFDGHSQTAFLVGDPKQSIYLFRQARVERFLHSMVSERLGDLPVGRLRLTANFRSQANLVDQFNQDFARIFPSGGDSQHRESVRFVAADAMRPADTAAARVWHTAVLSYVPPGEKSNAKKHQQEASAREIRGIVERWRARPLPPSRPVRGGKPEPWKIAVLVRSRNHLEAIVAALKDDSLGPPIPFRAVDIEPLKERPEIQDLFALTRALTHPADRTAWLAVLHAPWCGFRLVELHTLTGGDDPTFSERTIQSLIAERGDLLAPDAIQRLERIWPILESAARLRSRAPLAQIVERTWRSLGGDAYCSPSELANVRSYLHLLDTVEAQQAAQGNAGFATRIFEAQLNGLFAAPISDPSAIDIMTIHKAKGLEWDVVIVPSLERKAGSNRSQLLSWVELDSASRNENRAEDGQSAHFLLAPIAGKGEDSSQLKQWIASIHNAREAAERKRLFYVACTRAREELHLFAAPALSAKGEIKPKPDTLLDAAWPAAQPFFDEEQADEPLAIAASVNSPEEEPPTEADQEANSERPAILKRLPLAFDPLTRFANPHPLPTGARDESPSASHFERPEGSVAARAFGNAVHAFLERVTQQIADGEPIPALLSALPGWTPRVAAILRSEGLPPATVERLAQRVLHALDATLKDPIGRWLVSPRKAAATEYALTAFAGSQATSIRVDRTFNAGPEPLAPGSDHLWIVDYKNTTHSSEGLDAFLAEERARYAPQLEAYAAVLAPTLARTDAATPIRLALYYPMLARLIWWQPA